MSTPKDLSELRDSIAEVDRALLELLRERLLIAAEIGKVKAGAAIPVTVRDVEQRVLTRARAHAEICGVSEGVLEEVFRAILRASVERQYREGLALREQRGERILIVGGAGGMGVWFRKFFEGVGHTVEVLDPAFAPLGAAAGRYARLDDISDLGAYAAIVVAAPLSQTPAALDEITTRRPTCPVLEIASIKDHLRPALARARDANVRTLAVHPMFGPSKAFYETLTFVLAVQTESENGEEAELALLQPLLNHPYARLVPVPFLHHDRLMGWLLGLAHLTNILFGTAITRSGVDVRELRDCASTTFGRQASSALYVLSEDPSLYLDIQHLNPHRKAVYAATHEALSRLEALVEAGDREGFRKTFEEARRALAPDEE